MRKTLFLLLLCCASFLTACSSLPDGVQKPSLKINDLTSERVNNIPGFNVSYTIMHKTPEPLPLQELKFEVFVNGKIAGVLVIEPEEKIPSNIENHYEQFVPANKLPPVAADSLQTPMLKIAGKVDLTMVVDDSEKTQFLNQKDTYEGLIHAAGE